MKNIMIIALGTHCDYIFTHGLVRLFDDPTYKIHLICDEKNKQSDSQKNVTKYTYITPDYFLSDTDTQAADPSVNFLSWSLSHPIQAYEAYKLTSDIQDHAEKIIKENNLDKILIMYPALMILWKLPYENSVDVHIIYYAPSYPNSQVCWMFDSKMRKDDYEPYIEDDENIQSTLKYFTRIATFYGMEINEFLDIYYNVNHIIAWEKNMLKKDPTPVLSNMKTKYLGHIISQGNTDEIPNDLANIIKSFGKYNGLILVSFGTFATSSGLKDRVKKILKALQNYCKENNLYVIYHIGNVTDKLKDYCADNSQYASKDLDRIICYKGFIPYGTIVPQCKFVIFTGSTCLQTTCLYNKTPMIFVPLLTEQYFWAKNYKIQTGVDYIKPSDTEIDIRTYVQMMDSTKCKAFLKKMYVKLVENEKQINKKAKTIFR